LFSGDVTSNVRNPHPLHTHTEKRREKRERGERETERERRGETVSRSHFQTIISTSVRLKIKLFILKTAVSNQCIFWRPHNKNITTITLDTTQQQYQLSLTEIEIMTDCFMGSGEKIQCIISISM
jgi:hypothetical protein